jgi:hypothetical protein
MNASPLIPAPESIPAPAWLFLILEHALFLFHILLVNVVVGGSLIALGTRLFGRVQLQPTLSGLLGPYLPLILPFAINLGVAPLLFMQVVYGHLFYTSSVLMAVSWIAVIPLLILAYYGVYVYAHRQDRTSSINAIALALATLIFLYVGFMLVNNLTLMSEPGRWPAYFKQRGGTLLNLGDPILAPRYLHFMVASVAVAGLLGAVLAQRKITRGETNYEATLHTGLQVFAWSTLAQMGVGGWFLMALPAEATRAFMGRNLVATVVLTLGILAAVGAVVSALRGKPRPAVVQIIFTLVAMVFSRHQLRALYLEAHFKPESLTVAPQYSMLILFLVVLVAGLAAVAYMIRLASASAQGGAR